MSARDVVNSLVGGNHPPAVWGVALDALDAEATAKTLREVADTIEQEFPDPNPLASLFKPYVVNQIAARLRDLADETDHLWAERT